MLFNRFRDIFIQKNIQPYKLLVLATVLFLSALIPIWANQTMLMFTLAMVVGIGAFLVFSRIPQLGIILLFVGSLLIPFSIGTGTETGINISLILVAFLFFIWLITTLILKRSFDNYHSRPLLPLLLFLIVTIIAFIWGQLPWFYTSPAPIRAQVGGLLVFAFSFIAYFLASFQLKLVVWLRYLVYIFLIIGGFIVIALYFPSIASIVVSTSTPIINGSLFWTWLIAMSVSQSLFNYHLRILWRLIIGCVAITAIYYGFFILRTWSSGWIPALIAAFIVLWFGSPRLAKYVIVIAIIVGLFEFQDIYYIVMVGDNDYSLFSRLGAWNTLFEIIKQSPLLGFGPANYRFYTYLFPILGYSNLTFNSHNNYVDIIAQTGVLGLICFFWFIFQIARVGLKLRKKAAPGFDQAFVYGCLGGIAGTVVSGMFGDWIIPFVYNIGLIGFRASVIGWTFFGSLIALGRNYENNLGLTKQENIT